MSGTLAIALSGLRVAQQQIDITAHNVANANVEGYSRERAVVATKQSALGLQGSLGGGVDVTQVERLSDRWTASHLRSELADQGYYSTLGDNLSQVESIFNEANTKGIGDALNGLYASAQKLADNPEDTGARTSLTSSAQLLSTRLRNAAGQLSSISTDMKTQIMSRLDKVNGELAQLAQLNTVISGGIGAGGDPNTAKDERDLLLGQLATELGAQTYITTDERSAVVTLNGTNVADAGYAATIVFDGVGFRTSDGRPLTVQNGDLGAMVEMINPTDGVLKRYGTDLDTLASTVATSFNAVHSTGYGLDGVTGRPLFVGTTAGTLDVNPDLLAHPTHVAASSDGAAGDSRTASAMADLANSTPLAGMSITGFYQQLVGAIGSETAENKNQSNALANLVDDLKAQSASVKGVSLDEEMTNLIQFQQAYNAATRVISIVNTMTSQLLASLQ